MKVLSLFDGISCGQLALKKLGISIDTYYASEIDKYAISITQFNFPNTIQLGDVNKWKEWDIDWSSIDLLIGGSPCQNLSSMGNGLGLDGSESSLFYRYVEILNYIKSVNPNVKFLLENVKMKKEWEDVITNELKVSPVMIDSKYFTAQSRKRLYWTNIELPESFEHKSLTLNDVVEPIENKQHLNITDRMFKKKEGTLAYKKAWVAVRTLDRQARTLTCSQSITNSGATNVLYPDGQYYKLSEIECERLQTLPDNYTKYGIDEKGIVKPVSYTQRVQCVGNGWTVDVIAHILTNVLK